MAALARSIPLFYCLLYYRTGSQIGQSDRSSQLFSNSNREIKNLIRSSDRSGQTTSHNVSRSSTDGLGLSYSTDRGGQPSSTDGLGRSSSSTNEQYRSSSTDGRNQPSSTDGRNQPSSTDGRNQPSSTDGRNQPSSTEGLDRSSRTEGLGRSSSTERHWMFHNRIRDPQKMCSHILGQNLNLPELHQDRPRACSLQTLNDVRKVLSGPFTSEYDIRNIIQRLESTGDSERRGRNDERTMRRYVSHPRTEAELRAKMLGDMYCGTCVTEIAYQVMTEVTDLNGVNRTVINFNNAYQFIPSGLCMNENSPCSGGSARCKQIYRAHWTLVWSNLAGVEVVAHEVPSHCECVNLGRQSSPEDSFLSKAAQNIRRSFEEPVP